MTSEKFFEIFWNLVFLIAIIICANKYSTDDVLKWCAIYAIWKFAIVNSGRTSI